MLGANKELVMVFMECRVYVADVYLNVKCMKISRKAKEFEFLGRYYKIQYYFGSGIMSIEEKVDSKWWQSGYYRWKVIYMGHANPLVEAINFFNEQKNNEKRTK